MRYPHNLRLAYNINEIQLLVLFPKCKISNIIIHKVAMIIHYSLQMSAKSSDCKLGGCVFHTRMRAHTHTHTHIRDIKRPFKKD